MSLDLRDEVIRLARINTPNGEIAERTGLTVDALKKLIYRARKRGVAIPRRPNATAMIGKAQHKTEDWRDRAAKDARLKTVPEDTRDLTALICGDPLPGRRAIDMEGT